MGNGFCISGTETLGRRKLWTVWASPFFYVCHLIITHRNIYAIVLIEKSMLFSEACSRRRLFSIALLFCSDCVIFDEHKMPFNNRSV